MNEPVCSDFFCGVSPSSLSGSKDCEKEENNEREREREKKGKTRREREKNNNKRESECSFDEFNYCRSC